MPDLQIINNAPGVLLPISITELPPGAVINFSAVANCIDSRGRQQGPIDFRSFLGSVLALAFSDGKKCEVLGTAAMVAPGLAITTRHTFISDRESIDGMRDLILAGSTSMIAIGMNGQEMEIWRPYTFTEIEGTDLVLMGMNYTSPLIPYHMFHGMRISTRTPNIGEKVTAVGFRVTDTSFDIKESGNTKINGSAWVGVGEVSEVHPTSRDSSLMPWPSFEIKCNTYGGMSGGPIFDKYGFLIGIISTSYDFEDGMGPTFGSFLWDLIDTPVQGGWSALSRLRGPLTLRELAKDSCSIERVDSVTPSVPSKNGKRNFATCIPWSDEPDLS